MTTDIEVPYYNSGWQDLTDYVTAFEVVEKGISGISTAVVNLESTRSNLNTLISSPYKLLRVQVTQATGLVVLEQSVKIAKLEMEIVSLKEKISNLSG